MAWDVALILIFRNTASLRQIGTTGNFRMARMRDLHVRATLAILHVRSYAPIAYS
jgi:hypothetical protein